MRSLWIDPKKYPDFAWVWITRALVMLGFYAVMPFVNYYLVDVINIPAENASREGSPVLAIILITSSFSGVMGGVISDRIGRKRVVYVSNALIALMVLGFIFCQTKEQVLVIGSLFGIAYGAYSSVDYALGTDVLPSREHAGKEMAVWHVAMTLPQSIGTPIAGFLIAVFGKSESIVNGEKFTHYTPIGYTAVFIVAAICFAGGASLLRFVRGVK